MKIGIIDGELTNGGNHRFPNLACMKLAAHHKAQGDHVELVRRYEDLKRVKGYDRVYLSCVFTKTAEQVPQWVLRLPYLSYGGTGFCFDKTKALPHAVEHATPDYTLYEPFLRAHPSQRRFYEGFSTGFLTRGCFRRCGFCVHRSSRKVEVHSPLSEVIDPSGRNKDLCLLDDNILGLGLHDRPGLTRILNELNEYTTHTQSRYQFKQGLDIRLMRPEYAKLFAQAR